MGISVRLYNTEHKSNTVPCVLFALQPELQSDFHVSKHPPAVRNFSKSLTALVKLLNRAGNVLHMFAAFTKSVQSVSQKGHFPVFVAYNITRNVPS